MDNRFFKIKSEGRGCFYLAMQVAFSDKYGLNKTTHYSESDKYGLVFYRYEESGAIKLPVPLDWKGAADLAWIWLSNQKEEEYIDWCDHDGSNGKGFQVENGDWNRVKDTNHGMVSILPCWMWYGK